MDVIFHKYKNDGSNGKPRYLKYVCQICLLEFNPDNSKPLDVFKHAHKEHAGTNVLIKEEWEI